MAERRMTVEELNDLNPSESNPVQLTGISGPPVTIVSREYSGYWFAVDAKGCAIGRIDGDSLVHYKSKRQRKVVVSRDAWLRKDGTVQMKKSGSVQIPHGCKAIVLTAEYWE